MDINNNKSDYGVWKFLAWCGPACLVIFLGSWGILAQNFPPVGADLSPLEIAAHYRNNNMALVTGLSIAILAWGFYYAWGAAIAQVIRRVDGPDSILANLEAMGATITAVCPLIACAIGIPEFEYESNGTVGNLAAATADFRDQYYGLDGFLVESEEISECDRLDSHFPPIVTSGMIDLAECRWGAAPAKLLKQTWHAPRIDRSAMKENGTLDPWISQRLIPKILLATQTRIIEVFVDDKGRFVPSTPLISVMPKERDAIWRIASALASPVASALAMQRYAGSALSTQAIKLSAKQSLRLPIPVDEALWKQAASMLQEAHEANSSLRRSVLESFAGLIVSAYRVPQDQASPLLQWWLGRLK